MQVSFTFSSLLVGHLIHFYSYCYLILSGCSFNFITLLSWILGVNVFLSYKKVFSLFPDRVYNILRLIA